MLVLAVGLLALPGCWRGADQGRVPPPAAGGGEQDVPLLVLQGPGGSTAGYDAHLVKPVELADLLRWVERPPIRPGDVPAGGAAPAAPPA